MTDRRDWWQIRDALIDAEELTPPRHAHANQMAYDAGWLEEPSIQDSVSLLTWAGRDALDLLRDSDRLKAALERYPTKHVPWSLLSVDLGLMMQGMVPRAGVPLPVARGA